MSASSKDAVAKAREKLVALTAELAIQSQARAEEVRKQLGGYDPVERPQLSTVEALSQAQASHDRVRAEELAKSQRTASPLDGLNPEELGALKRVAKSPEAIALLDGADKNGKYACPDCQTRFTSKDSLEEHRAAVRDLDLDEEFRLAKQLVREGVSPTLKLAKFEAARRLKKVRIERVDLVKAPANPEAKVQLRKEDGQEVPEALNVLRTSLLKSCVADLRWGIDEAKKRDDPKLVASLAADLGRMAAALPPDSPEE